RSPGYALTAIVVLALGIGANTAVFTVVKGALLAPLGYPDAHRLVRIWSSHPERGLDFFGVSVADYLDWKRAGRAFTALGAFENERGVPITSTVGQPEEVLAARVTPELFSVLATPTLLGRPLRPEDVRRGEARVVVLSYEFWRSHLGEDSAAVGRALHLDEEPYTVVGVMPASFTIPGDDATIWTPLDVYRADVADDRGARFLRVLARLGSGVDPAQARAELAALAGRLAEAHPATNGGWTVNVRPIRDVVVGEDFRRALLVVFGAVGLVLLIACANVANLSVTRLTTRRRELALRAALGASRRRLVLLLLGETVLLAVAAAGLALLVASWGVALLPRLGAANIPRLDAIRLDLGVFAFTTAVSCVAILLSGLVPALATSRGSASEALNAGTRGTLHGPIGRRARRAAVIGQLGLATLLVAGAALLVRSFLNLREVDLGFEPRRVLTARINLGEGRYEEPAQVVTFYRRLIDELQTTAGVAAVGAVTSVPFGPGNSGNLFAPAGMAVDRANAPDTDYRVIAGDYFRAMGIPLIAGRTF
ncbi:MAG: ABC transporter permease, partial [Dehalococcoidia bacterium]